MIRSFVYLLLLLVVFLSGMLLGINRDPGIANGEHYNPSTDPVDIIGRVPHETSQDDLMDVMEIDRDSHFTEKTATLLETGVKGFYNIVVEVLYQVSRLFF